MPKSRWVSGPLGAVCLAALLAGAAGCGPPAPASDGPGDPVAVKVVHPERKTLPRLIEQPARVEAFEQTPIFVKVAGYADKVSVDAGTRVKKGDLLAELSVPELKEEVKQKQGLIVQGRVDVLLAEKGLKLAQGGARTAAALTAEARATKKRSEANHERWKSEAARLEGLVRTKVIDGQSLDEAVNQLRATEAALEEADARIQSADAAHDESLAKRDKAEAEVAAAHNRLALAETEERRVAALLEYTHVTAPFDGVVALRNVHTGHFVQPASGAGAKADPLFVVVRTDKVRVFLDVPETDAVLVRSGETEGCPVTIRVPVLNDREFCGRVTGTSWSLDPGQRTLRTEIDFENAEGVLRPGMYAHALIQVEQAGAWTLPGSAVATRDGQTFCYLVRDGKAVRTLVKVGARAGDLVEVLKLQGPPAKPGEKAPWLDFAGTEAVAARGGELSDGQAVRVAGGD